MKNRHPFIEKIAATLLLPFFVFVSCTKMPERLEGENAMGKVLAQVPFVMTDSANIYNCVWLMANQFVSPAADSATQIGLTASFTDSITGKVVGVKGLSINSTAISQSADSTFSFDYGDSTAYLQQGLNFYGTNVNFKITGSSLADTVSQSIYMPKQVNATAFPTGQINIGKNLPITWTPDPGNAWGNVVIKIWYNAAENRFLIDSTLPAKDTALTYTVPDNGSYTIDSTDLLRLKKNSYVTFSLGRGSEASAILPVSGRRVFYFASASQSSGPLTLIYAP